MRLTKILWGAVPALFLIAIAASMWGPGPERKPAVRVRAITITADLSDPNEIASAREKVEEIYKRLEEGADFQEIARSESEALNASEGGDMGWMGKGILPKHLEDVAFALEAGQHSEIIEDKAGDLRVFRILYTEERRNF